MNKLKHFKIPKVQNGEQENTFFHYYHAATQLISPKAVTLLVSRTPFGERFPVSVHAFSLLLSLFSHMRSHTVFILLLLVIHVHSTVI